MAIKISNTGTALAGIAKTILPGLFVSIIGGSFAFLVFNNPDKIRGKATLRAWKSLNQYERLYTENTDRIYCSTIRTEGYRFKNDMIHQIQMSIENLKNLLEKESNVDNLVLAIINMKVDSYNEMKKITEILLDSLDVLIKMNLQVVQDKETDKLASNWQYLHQEYMEECAYLKNRDTASLHKILKELSATYSLNFEVDNNLSDTAELEKNIIGKWGIALYDAEFELKADGTGSWRRMNKTFPCTWKLDSSNIKMIFNKVPGEYNSFSVVRSYPGILVLTQRGLSEGNSYVACKRN